MAFLGSLLFDPVTAGVATGAVALVLAAAAWHKFAAPDEFLAALSGYRLLPDFLLGPSVRLVPLAEAAVAAALVLPATRPAAAGAAATLLLLYAAAMATNLMRGRSYIDCGCGGGTTPLSWALVARNGVLACLAGLAVGAEPGRALSWLDGFTLAGGALCVFAAYLAADELIRLWVRVARRADPSGSAGATP